jgi:glycosyltransferase involved in cell wall biosynthesis
VTPTVGHLPDEMQPHVCLIVGDPIDHDTRVRKTAQSLASAGLRVTVVDVSTDGRYRERRLDGLFDVVDIPVEFLLKQRQVERRRFRRWLLVPVGYGTLLAHRAELRRRDVAFAELLASEGRALVDVKDSAPRRIPWLTARQQQRSAVRAYYRLRRTVTLVRGKARPLYTMSPTWLSTLRSHTAAFGGGWRRLLPEYLDLESAFGPVLDNLDPSVIHANDVNMIGIAERAAARARLRGRCVRWIYDAHEYVPGMARYRRDRLVGMALHEQEYIGAADAVLTVSEPLADALQARCKLMERPAVVANAPRLRRLTLDQPPSVRASLGLPDHVPLLVYSGNIGADRGLTTLVQALPLLPGLHAAIITNEPPENRYIRILDALATSGGVRERLHFLPYVPGDVIVEFVSSASVAFLGLISVPSHRFALPGKYFDYMHAGLPVVMSDIGLVAEMTTTLGNGELYRAGDPVALAEAVRAVLAAPMRYRHPLRDQALLRHWSWERQEQVLTEVYSRLLGLRVRPGAVTGSHGLVG